MEKPKPTQMMMLVAVPPRRRNSTMRQVISATIFRQAIEMATTRGHQLFEGEELAGR